MGEQVLGTHVLTDPCVVLGRVATALADGAPMADALGLLATGLGLRTAVLRAASGQLLGVGGELMHAVPLMRSVPGTSLELPVGTAFLSVVGARPSQLPALRAAAAVLALGLAPTAEELLEDAEDDRDLAADELHDGPVQSLVVARYAADAAVRGGDSGLARDAVQDSLVALRTTLWHLRPRGTTGLTDALEQLQRQVPYALEGDLPAGRLLQGARAVLAYRLVQAVVLGEPGTVTLSREDDLLVLDLLVLEVPAAPVDRFARRARALGGDLTSSAGRVRLALPLPTSHLTHDARTTP